MKKTPLRYLLVFALALPLALPLFFLMPENVAARYYALAILERQGTRWEVFLIPTGWLAADIVLHYVFRLVERRADPLPLGLAASRLATAGIFCAFAITNELLLYRSAMMVF